MVVIELLDKQQECLNQLANDNPSELILFGGGAGGAKSFTGCYWQIRRRLKYAGTRGLIGRAILDDLKKTTLNTFFEVARMHGLKAEQHYTYNPNAKTITFQNGSEIILKDLFQMPSDPHFETLGSLEITDFFVDECSQVTKKGIDILRSRVRYKLREYNLLPKGLLTCNPSKGWLYNEFYIPWKQGKLPEHLSFVRSLATDNYNLPASYINTLQSLPEQDRKRLLEGSWEYDESIDQLFHHDNLLHCFREHQPQGSKYITADIARLGKDRSVICVWHGLSLIHIHEYRKNTITEVVQRIKLLMQEHSITANHVVIDEDGVGGGAVDAIAGCRGFLNGSKATQSEKFINLKTECYFKLAEYVEQQSIYFLASHRDTIVKELDMIRRKNVDKDSRLQLISKDEIKLRHGISPDYADAIMMRMLFEVRKNYGHYSYV